MPRVVELTVRFAGQGSERRPIALTTRPPQWGTRITVRVAPECVAARAVHLLWRAGTDLVPFASVRAEEVEAARQAMGRSREAYRVIAAEVIDTAKEHLDRAPPRAREGRWARRSARLDAELAEG